MASRKTKWLLVFTAVILGVIIAAIFLVQKADKNMAEVDFKPFTAGMKSLGASVLCTDGDSGNIPLNDNTTSTYLVFYSVEDKGNLVETTISLATQMGYSLSTDVKHIEDLKTGNNIGVGQNGQPIEQFSSANDYLTSDVSHSFNHSAMNVKIIREGQIALSCNNSPFPYGTMKGPDKGQAIVEADLELYR